MTDDEFKTEILTQLTHLKVNLYHVAKALVFLGVCSQKNVNSDNKNSIEKLTDDVIHRLIDQEQERFEKSKVSTEG